MVGRSLVDGCSGIVKQETFNPSEEDVVLYKNTLTALVHPADVKDTLLHKKTQHKKEKRSVRKITKPTSL